MSRDVDLCRSLVYIWIMKKLMLLMLALAACVWGEVFIKDSVRIVFPQNICLDNVWQANEECFLEKAYDKERNYMKMKQARIFMNDLNCYGDVCSSILDTSIFFLEEEREFDYGFGRYFIDNGVNTDGESSVFAFYALSDATHSLMEVVRDEFKRFQECGYFDISSEEMDSILSDMDSILMPELDGKFHEDYYVTDCGKGTGCMEWCPITGPVCHWSKYTSIYEIIEKRNSQTSIPYHVDFAARITVENGRLLVPEGLESRAYMLYGLNGRVLRGGLLHNNMALPREPAILRVKDYGDVYLK